MDEVQNGPVTHFIVRDNHGDLQSVPIVNGMAFILPGYTILSRAELALELNELKFPSEIKRVRTND